MSGIFEAFKGFFERVRSIIFDKGTIRRVMGDTAAVSDEMTSAIRIWADMYENGESLKLPGAIAGEMARLITLELKSEVSGSSRAEIINKKYSEVIDGIRTPVEQGCAKGGLVFKPYVSGGGLCVDFIQADAFFPLAFNNSGRITSAAFAERIVRGDRFFTRIEKHELHGNEYTVTNRAFMSFSREHIGAPTALSDVPEWSRLAESMTIGNVTQPLFGYFKPALANRIDPSSPLGVSVFANAVSLIEEADAQYARLLWEFESGERALIANSMAFKLDRDGKLRLPNKRLYRTLDVEDADFFREWTPTMREQTCRQPTRLRRKSARQSSGAMQPLRTTRKRCVVRCAIWYMPWTYGAAYISLHPSENVKPPLSLMTALLPTAQRNLRKRHSLSLSE